MTEEDAALGLYSPLRTRAGRNEPQRRLRIYVRVTALPGDGEKRTTDSLCGSQRHDAGLLHAPPRQLLHNQSTCRFRPRRSARRPTAGRATRMRRARVTIGLRRPRRGMLSRHSHQAPAQKSPPTIRGTRFGLAQRVRERGRQRDELAGLQLELAGLADGRQHLAGDPVLERAGDRLVRAHDQAVEARLVDGAAAAATPPGVVIEIQPLLVGGERAERPLTGWPRPSTLHTSVAANHGAPSCVTTRTLWVTVRPSIRAERGGAEALRHRRGYRKFLCPSRPRTAGAATSDQDRNALTLSSQPLTSFSSRSLALTKFQGRFLPSLNAVASGRVASVRLAFR